MAKERNREVIASSLLDPNDSRSLLGARQIKNTHDVNISLTSTFADTEGKYTGAEASSMHCPAGLKCRWLSSHYNKETKTLLKDLAKIEEAKLTNYEINKIEPEHRIQLQKNKYEFKQATPYIKYLDSLVQNDANIAKRQEDIKNNISTYVEPPFAPAEKKKINLNRAKIVSPLTTVGNLPYRRLVALVSAIHL
ncbi:tRNA-dihydrouridine synthase 3 [Clavispora lusitaniae]|nr:tRNA-dihydrouridine synthase 3 [Clavispora lusitaniae]